MKGRLNSTIGMLVVVNLIALVVVMVLAYGAGASAPQHSMFDLASPGAMKVMGAAAVALIMAVVMWMWLGSRVTTPVRQLVEFAERVGAGDLKPRLSVEGNDDFALAVSPRVRHTSFQRK